MDEKPFVSTELKDSDIPKFMNHDDAAKDKNLTDRRVAENSLDAVFSDRPSYFCKKQSSE